MLLVRWVSRTSRLIIPSPISSHIFLHRLLIIRVRSNRLAFDVVFHEALAPNSVGSWPQLPLLGFCLSLFLLNLYLGTPPSVAKAFKAHIEVAIGHHPIGWELRQGKLSAADYTSLRSFSVHFSAIGLISSFNVSEFCSSISSKGLSP